MGQGAAAWIADFMLYLFGLSAYLFSAFLMTRVVAGYRKLYRDPTENPAELNRFAKINRVERVMQPYLEAMAA